MEYLVQVIEGGNTGEEIVEEAILDVASPASLNPGLQGHQLVTVVINVYNDALQQALQQAQQDLHSAHLQSTTLQQQINLLTAQLQAVHQRSAGSSSHRRIPSLAAEKATASTHDRTATNLQATANGPNAEQRQSAPTEVATGQDLPMPLSTTVAQIPRSELEQLRQQLQALQEQADAAAQQRSSALQLVETLQAELAQQGSSLEAEVGRTEALKDQLAAAEQKAFSATAEVLRFRLVAMLLVLLPSK